MSDGYNIWMDHACIDGEGHALLLGAYVHMKTRHAEQYKKAALYEQTSGQGVTRNEENCKCTFNLF